MSIIANSNEPDNGEQHHLSTYLPLKEVHVVTGRSGAGKTHLTFQFLDRYRQHLEPILYIVGDRSQEHYDRLFEKLEIKPWPLVSLVDHDAEQLTVSQIVGQVEDYQRPFLWLDAYIEEMDAAPRTLVLDPGQRFIPCKNLNSQASAANGFAAVASWAAKRGITVILLWHVNKLPQKDLNDPFDRISGSHAIQGYCSTKAYLEVGGESDPIRLHLRGQRFRELVVRLVREENGAFRIADILDEIRADYPVYCVLPENELPRQEIIRLCGISPDEAISSLSERTIDRQLKELVELGHVAKRGHGRYCKKVVPIGVKPTDATP